MLSITNQSNYLAQVVKLDQPKKHPNADRLQIWTVAGYDVITDLSRQSGDICIFFPVECQINSDILSRMNMYSDKDLNQDKNIAGYIHKSGRVKAVALRGVVSDGIILPYNEVLDCFNIAYSFHAYKGENFIGQWFDTLDGHVICQKYVPIVKDVRSGTGQGKKEKGPKIKDIIVPGQFNFHYSTSKLQDNIWKFNNPDDTIVITDKWHGTSIVLSNVLVNRKLSIWEKIKKMFGYKVQLTEYKKMYSSRTVIKHIDDLYHTENQGYYNTDIWGKVFEENKYILPKGTTLYGEIVGYQGDRCIQPKYDYGCKIGEHKFLVYRITITDEDGFIVEYSWNQVKFYCSMVGLESVPELYYGTIKDWQKKYGKKDETFLDSLKGHYLEQDCEHCVNKVPAEGICIRNESTDKIAYKLKSRKFLLGESAQLDSGEQILE